MFFFVWFLIPETKGLSLEKMDDLFGVTDMVHKVDVESNAGSDHRGTARENENEKKQAVVTIPEVEVASATTGARGADDGLEKEETRHKIRDTEHAEYIEHAHTSEASSKPVQTSGPEITTAEEKEIGLRGGAGSARALTPTRHFMGKGKDNSETGSVSDQVGFYC